MTLPRSVNFTALPARLISTWRRWCGSPRTAGGTSGIIDTTKSTPLTAAWAETMRQVLLTSACRSKSVFSSTTLPASILEKSSTSSISPSISARGAAQRLQHVGLLAVQLGVAQKVGHADDGVQRRAQLVAHHRDEAALRQVRRLGARDGVEHAAHERQHVQVHRDHRDQQADAERRCARQNSFR